MFKKNKAAEESPVKSLEGPEEEPKSEELTYNFTMGNVEDSMVTLIDDEFNSMQVYDYLLPKDLMPGQIVTVTFKRNIQL